MGIIIKAENDCCNVGPPLSCNALQLPPFYVTTTTTIIIICIGKKCEHLTNMRFVVKSGF